MPVDNEDEAIGCFSPFLHLFLSFVAWERKKKEKGEDEKEFDSQPQWVKC